MSNPLKFGPPVLTVDVEDWPQSTWDRNLPITQRVVTNTRRLLRLLEQVDVTATMFILGKVARSFPALVKEIHAAGHEIACHGYGHVEIFQQSPGQFASDVREAKDLLEQSIGERIRGYRAPDFSVVHGTLWALDVLAAAGFDYDSSIFPVRRSRYGIPDWPPAPVTVALGGARSIIEIPIATYRGLGRNWPIGGGGYNRLLPGPVTRRLAGETMKSMPFVLYCHPYELDASEFHEISLRIPWLVRLHQGLGRRFVLERLEGFLRQFGGRTVQDLISGLTCPVIHLDSSSAAPTWS